MWTRNDEPRERVRLYQTRVYSCESVSLVARTTWSRKDLMRRIRRFHCFLLSPYDTNIKYKIWQTSSCVFILFGAGRIIESGSNLRIRGRSSYCMTITSVIFKSVRFFVRWIRTDFLAFRVLPRRNRTSDSDDTRHNLTSVTVVCGKFSANDDEW